MSRRDYAQPPTREQIEDLLPWCRRQDATATNIGFDWQRWLTIETWLRLKEDEAVWIEWAEDIILARADGEVKTIQAKSGGRPWSLGQKRTLELISRAFERPAPVETFVWTKASIAPEKTRPFDKPGVRHWIELSSSGDSIDSLRTYLAEPGRLTTDARAAVMRGDENQFRKLIGRVKWIVDEPGLEELRQRAQNGVLTKLRALNVLGAELLCESAAAKLFDAVALVALRDHGERRLTMFQLEDILLAHTSDMDSRALLVLPAHAPEPRPPLRSAKANSEVKLTPLTPAWFTYTAASISMVGREAELALLKRFSESDAAFLWWAVGGPAGVGKSRLAREFVMGLGPEWREGFATVADLAALEPYIRTLDYSYFVVIDYASIDPDAVGRFLAGCHRSARPTRKLRVLLLDRESGSGAHWLSRLRAQTTSLAWQIAEGEFAIPFALPALKGHERRITSAWLEAAGLDANRILPPKKARFWLDLRHLTGSRPLHLGLAAAALARGKTRFESVHDLLTAMLQREFARWHEIEPEPKRYADCLRLVATATLMQDLPLPWPGDPLPIAVGDRSGVLVVSREGQPDRLPTLDELLATPKLRAPTLEFLNGRIDAVGSILAPGMERRQFVELLSDVRRMTGESWRPRPDIVAEAFLAEYWANRPALPGIGVDLPTVTDEMLSDQLRAAWKLRPLETIYTIDELRTQPWGAEAFVRAALRLTDELMESIDLNSVQVDSLSALLLDGSVSLGGVATSAARAEQFLAPLRKLAGKFPRSVPVAYRLWKGLKAGYAQLPESERGRRVEELFATASTFLAARLQSDEEAYPWEFHALEVAAAHAGFLQQDDHDSFVKVVDFVRAVNEAVGDDSDLRNALAPQLASIYGSTARILPINEIHEGPDLAKARNLAAALHDAIEFLGDASASLDTSVKTELAMALSNLSIFLSQHLFGERVEKCLQLFDRLWPPGLPSRPGEVRIEILASMQHVYLKCGDFAAARRVLESAISHLKRPTGHPGFTVLNMIRAGMRILLSQDVTSEWLFYLRQLCGMVWNYRDKAIRDLIVEDLSQTSLIVGSRGDEKLMRDTAQLLEPWMDKPPLRKVLQDTFWTRPSIARVTHADTEQALRALLKYANVAFSQGAISFDLEMRIISSIGIYFHRHGDSYTNETRSLWPFTVQRLTDGLIEVTTDKNNYAGIGLRGTYDFREGATPAGEAYSARSGVAPVHFQTWSLEISPSGQRERAHRRYMTSVAMPFQREREAPSVDSVEGN